MDSHQPATRRIAENTLDSRDGDEQEDSFDACTVVVPPLPLLRVVVKSCTPSEKHLPRTRTYYYHVTPEDIFAGHETVADPCTQDVVELPKIVVVWELIVMIPDGHVEVVASILGEGHKPLPVVVDYVRVYDTEVAVRHYCCSLPNIPFPS